METANLFFAAETGNIEGISIALLSHDIDINARDEEGKTALTVAVINNQAAAVQSLLKGSADINAVDYRGRTCVYLAAMDGLSEMVELLVSFKADISIHKSLYTPLHMGAIHGHPRVARILLNSGDSPLKRDRRGRTSVHCAAERGRLGVIQEFKEFLSPATFAIFNNEPTSELSALAQSLLDGLIGGNQNPAKLTETLSDIQVLGYGSRSEEFPGCRAVMKALIFELEFINVLGGILAQKISTATNSRLKTDIEIVEEILWTVSAVFPRRAEGLSGHPIIVEQYRVLLAHASSSADVAPFVAGASMWAIIVNSICWKAGTPSPESVTIVKDNAIKLVSHLIERAFEAGRIELESGPHRAMAACDDCMSTTDRVLRVEIVEAFVANGTIRSIILLSQPLFLASSQIEIPSRENRTFLKNAFEALANMAFVPSVRTHLRELQVDQLFLATIASPNTPTGTKVNCICGIALLLGSEEDAAGVVVQSHVVSVLVQALASFSPGSGDHTTRFVGLNFNFQELIESVAVLCIADANKSLLVSEGLIPLLFGVLEDSSHADTVVAHASLAIWRLLFCEEGKNVVSENPDMISTLESFAHQPGLASKNCEACLFLLGRRADSRNEGSETGVSVEVGGGHVMLSYNWAHQGIVKEVRDRLREFGFNVWMDIDDMAGSTLGAMAKAVDDASCVLFFVSSQYKDSANCRLEAEYAMTSKKTMIPLMLEKGYAPRGWLGLILGSKLWFDCTSVEALQSSLPSLVKALGEMGRTPTPSIRAAPDDFPATRGRATSESAKPSKIHFQETVHHVESEVKVIQELKASVERGRSVIGVSESHEAKRWEALYHQEKERHEKERDSLLKHLEEERRGSCLQLQEWKDRAQMWEKLFMEERRRTDTERERWEQLFLDERARLDKILFPAASLQLRNFEELQLEAQNAKERLDRLRSSQFKN